MATLYQTSRGFGVDYRDENEHRHRVFIGSESAAALAKLQIESDVRQRKAKLHSFALLPAQRMNFTGYNGGNQSSHASGDRVVNQAHQALAVYSTALVERRIDNRDDAMRHGGSRSVRTLGSYGTHLKASSVSPERWGHGQFRI